jgi:hydrogenase maturation protein HypF
MELESLAGSLPANALAMPIRDEAGVLLIDPLPMLVALGARRQRGDDVGVLAAQFHESVIDALVGVVIRVAEAENVRVVALGGGSFQNARLLAGVRRHLGERGLRVLVPAQLGPNDGAISFGQAAIAAALLADAR